MRRTKQDADIRDAEAKLKIAQAGGNRKQIEGAQEMLTMLRCMHPGPCKQRRRPRSTKKRRQLIGRIRANRKTPEAP